MSGLAGPVVALPAVTLVDLVEQQVAASPDAVALVAGAETMRYAALDARANRLARLLVERGVGPDVPVGISVERSADLAVGLLGILKAGGACLPLDPGYPPERLAFMLDDARPPVLLTQTHLRARLPGAGHVLCLDEEARAGDSDRPPRVTGPDHLAYVIYTSGSTGQPKGVMLTHRGLVNHSLAVSRLYALTPADRVAQFCSISFDVSIEELFPTWISGGSVALRRDEVPVLGAAWSEWLCQTGLTVLNLPTAYWHEWVRDLQRRGAQVPDGVRLVIVGGEKALGSVYRAWLHVGGDRIRWVNAYGPAEASVLATAYDPSAEGGWHGDGDPPIGRPVDNTLVRILDERGRPVPPGTAGDLHVGGVGVARGYLGRPDLTAERFVPDPFGDQPSARLYRTGDRARQLPDGTVEFLGRLDDQVKIRGFRIECREVEDALAGQPDVTEAVVVAREDEPGIRRLVAYVVPRAGTAPTSTQLRAFLGERLPPYMLPSAFVRLDALPRTPNDKVDRDALPTPGDPRGDLATAWTAPRTATETAILGIWSRVLGVDDIGADDDFFELGGHSLQATQVIAEVRETLGAGVDVRALFEAPTVARLAALVDASRGRPVPPPLVPQPRDPATPIPLTLSQEQMWRLETSADPPGLYNVTALHRFSGTVDERALREALGHVAGRHEALRTSIQVAAGVPYQRVAPSVPVVLAVSDVDPADAAGLQRLLAAQDAAAFDVAATPLWRAHLYRVGDDAVLAVTFDHLVCDGTSAYVFLAEVTAAYEACAAGGAPALRPLAVQYPDFALWQRAWLTEDRLEEQVAYWRRKLAGAPRGPAVPFDRVPASPTRRIVARPLRVPTARYDALQRLARATRSTVFVVTVAAVQALCARLSGTSDVMFSTTLSGRQRAELEGLIGCFHGVGRIRTELSGDPPFTGAVARVRDTVLELFAHQDVPFMRVRQAVLADFPTSGPALLAAVPTDFQYFHTAHEEWAPGAAVVERPGGQQGPDELFFRGQLHPLNVTFLDDGSQLWGQFSYKTDFYDDATIARLADGLDAVVAAVTEDPELPLSQLPVPPPPAQG